MWIQRRRLLPMTRNKPKSFSLSLSLYGPKPIIWFSPRTCLGEARAGPAQPVKTSYHHRDHRRIARAGSSRFQRLTWRPQKPSDPYTLPLRLKGRQDLIPLNKLIVEIYLKRKNNPDASGDGNVRGRHVPVRREAT